MTQANLHQHSDGSLLDGAVGVREIAQWAKGIGAEAIAITDHNECNQHMAFQKVCKEYDLHPVLGIEADWVDSVYNTRDNPETKLTYPTNRSHICLLAETNKGLHNIWALSSLAYTKKYRFHKPLIEPKLMEQYKEGIYASDGCMITELGRAVEVGDDTRVRAFYGTLKDIYGDHLYVELHTWQFRNPNTDEKRRLNDLMGKINRAKVEYATKEGIPMVVVNDSHHTDPEKWEQKELVWRFSTSHRNRGDDQEVNDYGQKADHLMKGSELHHWMRLHGVADNVVDEAIKNAADIAFKCHAEITRTLDMPRLGDSEQEDFRDLVAAVTKGFRDKVSRAQLPEEIYHNRLVKELTLIREKGFAGYFMVEKDLIDATVSGKWASGSNQPMLVGPGRGSGGGALVNYLLGITSLDPIHYDLLFERFLTPGRKDWPDIDVDFPQTMRLGAKGYLEQRHHKECVCTIGTLGRSGPKALLRDLGRALEIPGFDVDKMARIIDKVKAVEVEEGEEELGWDLIFEQRGGDFKEWINKSDKHRELFKRIKDMQGIIRNSSQHASGVVVSNKPLLGNIPYRVRGEQLITQLDMYEVEELGAVKMDLLGLRHLDTLMFARNLIYERHGKWLDYRTDRLPKELRRAYAQPPRGIDEVVEFGYELYADEAIWPDIAAGHTLGVFQLETPELSRTSQQLQPKNEKDVAALISIVRPGVKDAKLDQVYLARRNGKSKVVYDHPMMKSITADTYGVMIYQEQLLRAVQELGGFTPDEADDLRKALGKKNMEKVVALKSKFIEGCISNLDFVRPWHSEPWTSLDKKTERKCRGIAERIWASVEASGRYAFNKSHAVGYALISTWEAWTKHYFRLEFMVALMATDGENINRYVRESRRMGIQILPPDVNLSEMLFTIDPNRDNTIRYGLAAIKGVAGECCREIMAKRGMFYGGPFTDVVDLAGRCDSKKVSKGKIESLIKIGALDSFTDGKPWQREILMTEYHDQRIVERAAESKQATFRDSWSAREQHIAAWRAKHKDDPAYQEEFKIPNFDVDQEIYKIEQELVGNYILIDPLAPYIERLEQRPVLAEPVDLDALDLKEECYIGGLLTRVKPVNVKKAGRYQGREMAFLEVTWNEQVHDITVFPDLWDKQKGLMVEGFPVCCLVQRDAQSCHLILLERLDRAHG